MTTETPWPTIAEVYADAGQTPPPWSTLPGLCDKVCPLHDRHCAQPHVDDIGHACAFCTTGGPVRSPHAGWIAIGSDLVSEWEEA